MPTLKELRQAKGLSQARLAELVGAAQPDIARLEKGVRKLTVDWVMRLSPALGVEPSDLLPTPKGAPHRAAPARATGQDPRPTHADDSTDVNLLYHVIVRVETWLQEDGIAPSPEDKARLLLIFYDIASKSSAPLEFNPRDYPNVVRLSQKL